MSENKRDERGFLAEQPLPTLVKANRDKANRDKPSGDGTHGDKPHYLGHRDRLRERFAGAGPDALPDYEFLELLLFRLVPRATGQSLHWPAPKRRSPAAPFRWGLIYLGTYIVANYSQFFRRDSSKTACIAPCLGHSL